MTPRAYSRLETDDELCARLRAQHPHAVRYIAEGADTFADRYQMQRRLIWITPAEARP